MSMVNSRKCYIPRTTGKGIISQSWFLESEGENKKAQYPASQASIKTLVNGEEAFGEVYERINNAKKSIDIATWGFQPSMFFKRDGNSLCIGDLLIKKALEGVEVKVLVWSMNRFHTQTFNDANLGNMPGLLAFFQKTGVDDVLNSQKDYDYWWYKAISGCSYIPERAPNALLFFNKSGENIYNESYKTLMRFANPENKNRIKLQYKNRRVEKQNNQYVDDLLWITRKTLDKTASHHQKTVLIDYEDPDNAIGFVMEHNMIDCYWDTKEHIIKKLDSSSNDISFDLPNQGRNVKVPWQDVSSMVTGEILYDINQNFCEAWNRETNFSYVMNEPDEYSHILQETYQKSLNAYSKKLERNIERRDFKPKKGDRYGKIAKAQILRTYDKPDIEEIKEMYLQNITKVSRYIYTENQYFRFPPLVDTFIDHWEKMKLAGRNDQQPIHWFVVTNSSDDGVDVGSYTTNEMFKRLGRQDVMPNVAKNVDGELPSDKSYEKILKERLIKLDKEIEELQIKVTNRNCKSVEEVESIKARMETLQDQKKSLENRQAIDNYEKFSQTIGIKSVICTLVANEKESDFNPPKWQEVYIHSKVTIIDDVFMFLGSANLNSRSMQADTELGIITECQDLALGLRKELWGVHTKNDPVANPTESINSTDLASKTYKSWVDLSERNFVLKSKLKPLASLTRFYRDSGWLGYWD